MGVYTRALHIDKVRARTFQLLWIIGTKYAREQNLIYPVANVQ